MTFTDADLNQMKIWIDATNSELYGRFPFHQIKALLARLEAAEKVAWLGIEGQYGTEAFSKAALAWRKAAGK